MSYENIKNLKPEEFKRFCGVRPETFGQMVKVLKEHEKSKKKWPTFQIKFRKPDFNDAGIFERIPDFFSYRPKLGIK